MASFIEIGNTEITKEIRLGGVPITLYQYDEQIINPLNSNKETVYAIGMIVKTSLTPSILSKRTEISFVWNGIRYAASQDEDGKLYFTATQIGEQTPTDVMILEGIPIGIGSSKQMMFHDSGFSEDNIEEYTSFVLGGVPLTVGRIENNYYLVVYSI